LVFKGGTPKKHSGARLTKAAKKILANFPTKFSLKNIKFGPYMNEKTCVPKYAAAYMVCKGIASISGT